MGDVNLNETENPLDLLEEEKDEEEEEEAQALPVRTARAPMRSPWKKVSRGMKLLGWRR